MTLIGCQEQSQDTIDETSGTNTDVNKERPKNIILLIGDGMGLSQVSAAQFYKEGTPSFERFPVVGLSKTSSSDQLITDSAAGATAFASGVKTYNGAVGMNRDSISVPTILEQMSEQGYHSGVIATSSITHATPAAFYAHVKRRGQAEDIASQMPASGVDFFAGGGLQYFNHRSDGADLIQELVDSGFAVDTTSIETQLTAEKQAYLLAADGMPRMLDGRGDFLPKATAKAIEQLNSGDKGFFLMVEGSQIDWGGHANETDYLVSELLDFDQVIDQVLDFAEKDGQTLVIVTADHETGGFTLSDLDGDYNQVNGTYSTGGHSATMVPVFAYGPGSESFGGTYPNNEIYFKMVRAIGLVVD
ncbi:alkaline phosphatase [Aureitalea marina]|uniref:Alkaline phosphatase n=1 Tax=Aureitalea marina TaxID=930804 RepID=A0A2S7KU19_9FLAO|nr:alkaline phosphatase [Aureitalea marina]